MFDHLRALEARESSTALGTNHPPVRRFEPLTVLGCVEGVRPAIERSPVICLPELVVLPCVNEFVANGRTELLPAVLLERVPRKRDRYLAFSGVVSCFDGEGNG